MTKYAALFDKRAEYYCLRVSFLHAAGGPGLQLLQDSLFEYLDSAEDQDAVVTQGLWTYIEENHTHFDVTPPVSDSPPGFAVAAWPLLVDCMCDEGGSSI